MRHLFTFFFRLFFAFLAAKLLAGLVGLAGLNPLIILTGLLLANIYLFDFLDYRSRTSWRRRRSSQAPEQAPPVPPAGPETPPAT
jgi:hypothetical protein